MTTDPLTYYTALALVEAISRAIDTGRAHFRDRDGRLLKTLDEVITALEDERLSLAPYWFVFREIGA